MVVSLLQKGLRYNDETDFGAQTERRGGSRPVRTLLGGENSPAAFRFSVACSCDGS
jgi:hypothetical protein